MQKKLGRVQKSSKIVIKCWAWREKQSVILEICRKILQQSISTANVLHHITYIYIYIYRWYLNIPRYPMHVRYRNEYTNNPRIPTKGFSTGRHFSISSSKYVHYRYIYCYRPPATITRFTIWNGWSDLVAPVTGQCTL